MTDPNTIDLRDDLPDPMVWTAPFTARLDWPRNEKYEFFEYACHEGDEQVRNYIVADRSSARRMRPPRPPQRRRLRSRLLHQLGAAAEYRAALHILNPRSPNWTPPVTTYSALTGDGVAELWAQVLLHRERMTASGELAARRREQQVRWMWSMLEERMLGRLSWTRASARGCRRSRPRSPTEGSLRPWRWTKSRRCSTSSATRRFCRVPFSRRRKNLRLGSWIWPTNPFIPLRKSAKTSVGR